MVHVLVVGALVAIGASLSEPHTYDEWQFCLSVYSNFMLSCNSFPNCGQSLPKIQMGFVHNYSMTRARILGNDCPQFGELLQNWIKLLYTSCRIFLFDPHFNCHAEGKCSSSLRHHGEATAGQLGVTFACWYSCMILSLFFLSFYYL